MNKKYLFLIILIVIIIIAGGILFWRYKNNEKTKNQNTNTARLATETNIVENKEEEKNNEENKNIIQERIETKEVELGSYSTPLKSKAEGRLNNIRLTCSTLNGKIVSSGETFSFCQTLGPSTAEKGYKEADVIINGETVQALGGGNCQVSSTLYNVILEVDGLEVIERHEHGKDVTYVPDGKDAAVSYGSMDLKFKNNLDSDIKMYFSSDDQNVTVRLVKLTKS